MNIKFESADKINGLMTISIEQADYQEAVDKKLKEYRKKAQVPGFRPGMVPMGLIKKQYGTAVKVDEVNRILGEKLADFIQFSAPEAIVLFGGLARAKEFIYEPTYKSMNDNVLPLWKGKVKLLFSQLKESDAAILGASALAWEL